jgi:trehalose-6-phosphate synthase
VPVSTQEYQAHYNLRSSDLEWKLSHGRPGDCDEFSGWSSDVAYGMHVRLAQRLVEAPQADGCQNPIFFLQDFHLYTVAQEMRNLQPGLRSGIMIHTPPPRWEYIRSYQSSSAGRHASDMYFLGTLRGMLGNDMIACQSVSDAQALMETFREAGRLYSPRAGRGQGILDVYPDEGLVSVYEGPDAPRRWVRVVALPVSLDLDIIKNEVAQAAKPVEDFYAENRLTGKKVIASVGRADITKHTVELVEEWGAALDVRPEYAKTCALLLVSPVTRKDVKGYTDEMGRLVDAVAKVQARHGRDALVHVGGNGWPHEMVMASYARPELIATVLASKKEGMGLPGHEIYAAKEGRGEATYIVGREAGSYHFFPQNAVVPLEDPTQRGQIRDAYLKTLSMTSDELRRSCAAGYARVSSWTARHWNDRGLDAIATAAAHRYHPERGVTVEDFMIG